MDNNRGSRLDKFEQKRKLTKLITGLVIVAGVLLVFLIGIFVFSDSEASKQREQALNTGDESESASAVKTETDSENIKKKSDAEAEKEKAKAEEEKKAELEREKKEKEEKEKKKKEKEDKDKKDKDKLKKKKAKPSDDNVKKAYTADWKPVGTKQSGNHTTNYNDGSQDRAEMEKAIKEATGLSSMTTWWLGHDGEQQVTATVSNKSKDEEVYRVQLKWVDGKGWKPEKVEELKKNDQKYRFR